MKEIICIEMKAAVGLIGYGIYFLFINSHILAEGSPDTPNIPRNCGTGLLLFWRVSVQKKV